MLQQLPELSFIGSLLGLQYDYRMPPSAMHFRPNTSYSSYPHQHYRFPISISLVKKLTRSLLFFVILLVLFVMFVGMAQQRSLQRYQQKEEGRQSLLVYKMKMATSQRHDDSKNIDDNDYTNTNNNKNIIDTDNNNNENTNNKQDDIGVHDKIDEEKEEDEDDGKGENEDDGNDDDYDDDGVNSDNSANEINNNNNDNNNNKPRGFLNRFVEMKSNVDDVTNDPKTMRPRADGGRD